MSSVKVSILDGFLAGIMIAFGGTVLLSCEDRLTGTVLFCVALTAICLFGFNLYTGKIGFLLENHSSSELRITFFGLLGNILGTAAMGFIVALALPHLRDAAIAACTRRLTQLPGQTLLLGFLCGILMYTAVWIWKKKKNLVGVFFCIPVFLLSGFEHSVADMFYFSLAGLFRGQSIVFLLLVILGNSLGGLFIPAVQALKGDAAP